MDDELDGTTALRALQQSHGLFLFADGDGVVRWANQGSELLGYAPAELAGRHLVEFLHPDDVARALEALTVQTALGEHRQGSRSGGNRR